MPILNMQEVSVEEMSKLSGKSIAFPCISTGIYGFPKEQAALIALKTVGECLERMCKIEKVIFCCFSDEDCQRYQSLMSK